MTCSSNASSEKSDIEKTTSSYSDRKLKDLIEPLPGSRSSNYFTKGNHFEGNHLNHFEQQPGENSSELYLELSHLMQASENSLLVR